MFLRLKSPLFDRRGDWRRLFCQEYSSQLLFPPRMAVNPSIRPIYIRRHIRRFCCRVCGSTVAFGCPDVQAPHGGWIKRQDNTVVFGCSDSRDKWQLRCQGVTWVGDRKNCSKGAYSVTLLECLIVRMIRVAFSWRILNENSRCNEYLSFKNKYSCTFKTCTISVTLSKILRASKFVWLVINLCRNSKTVHFKVNSWGTELF